MSTNYIVHLNNSFKRFTADEKATPFHISLYMALFHKWNSAKFRNPISVARDDLMFLSKIGSANTYTKCLKELHAWGYIKYEPSHSYHVGSKIYMYTFNKTINTTITKTKHNASDISHHQTTGNTSAKDVRPYKNNNKQENNLNLTNEQTSQNSFQSQQSTKEFSNSSSNHVATKSTAGKKSKTKKFSKPTLEELKVYFSEKEENSEEAEKFYNYFESNGWLIGGKTPMQNWQAAANNWVLNSKKHALGKLNLINHSPHPAGKLHTEINKNYNEPL